jgi:hypothetical protein
MTAAQPFAGCAAVLVFAAFAILARLLNCVPVSWVRARQTIEKGNNV